MLPFENSSSGVGTAAAGNQISTTAGALQDVNNSSIIVIDMRNNYV